MHLDFGAFGFFEDFLYGTIRAVQGFWVVGFRAEGLQVYRSESLGLRIWGNHGVEVAGGLAPCARRLS